MFIRIELISLFIGPNGVLNLMVSGLTPDTYSSNPADRLGRESRDTVGHETPLAGLSVTR